jgi:16S rRNA (uracil1498-N3)-methyltransferase
VQRIKIDEELLFFDLERNIQFRCKVVDFGKDEIILRVVDSSLISRAKPEIVLIQSLIQKSSFEDELNRLSELGVDIVQPIISKHSQNYEFDDKYMERLRRIAFEGAKTVGNPFPTKVLRPFSITKTYSDFKEFVSSFQGTTFKILFTNRNIGGVSLNLFEVIEEVRNFDRVIFCVGSEGGFTSEEEDNIASLGFTPVNLGKEILLRSDTVSVGVSFVFRLTRFL